MSRDWRNVSCDGDNSSTITSKDTQFESDLVKYLSTRKSVFMVKS